MKRNLKTIAKQAVFIGLIIAASTFTSKAADSTIYNKPTAVDLKLVGDADETPLFQLSVFNLQHQKMRITIENEYGNVIFAETSTSIKYNRTFSFSDVNDENTMNLKFKVTFQDGTKKVFVADNLSNFENNFSIASR